MIKSCKVASRLISEQLDHPLSFKEWISLKFHLAMCTNCVFFSRQIRALKSIIGKHKLPEDELPAPYTTSLSREVQERIKESMREEK